MKVAVIGGGGVRTLMLARTLAQNAKELHFDELCFMDNNEMKLDIYGEMGRQVALRIDPDLKVELTTDPIEAVRNADYIITTIRVGEDDKRVDDERIALARNVLGQETTGAAGFSFAMRSIPALAEYCRLAKQYSKPGVIIFNFTNPAGVVSQTLRDMGYDFTIGICDAPTGMLRSFANLYGIDKDSITARCYGLNHLSFFDSIKFGDKEMLPTILADDRVYAETDMRYFSKDLAQKYGCALNEYLYYFFYREKAVANILAAGQTRGELIRYVNQNMTSELIKMDRVKRFEDCLDVYVKWHGYRSAMYMKNETNVQIATPYKFNIDSRDDGGYAGVALSYIRAVQTGVPTEMIFCVPNNGAIAGLRDDDVVEISSTINPDGSYTPHKVSDPAELPMELIRRVKIYERYASRAIRNRNIEDAIDCLMVHPLVNSYSLAEELVEAYIKSNKDYIEGWH